MNEKKIYFIYSNNVMRDVQFAREFHQLLPTEIDICEFGLVNKLMVDFKGKLSEEKLPHLLVEKEKPFCLTGSAYSILINLNRRDPENFDFLCTKEKYRHENIKNALCTFISEGRIKIGAEKISALLQDLKKDRYCWPPKYK